MSVIDYFRPRTKERLVKGEYVHWVYNNPRSAYIRQCVLSYPPWVNRDALKAVWDECRRLEVKYGEPYVIDHIIPLNHPHVSGLSIP